MAQIAAVVVWETGWWAASAATSATGLRRSAADSTVAHLDTATSNGQSSGVSLALVVLLVAALAVGFVVAVIARGARSRERYPAAAAVGSPDQHYARTRHAVLEARIILDEVDTIDAVDGGSVAALDLLGRRLDLLAAELADATTAATDPDDAQLIRTSAVRAQALADAVATERRLAEHFDHEAPPRSPSAELPSRRRALEESLAALGQRLGAI